MRRAAVNLVLFRRDLRIHDHTALLAACGIQIGIGHDTTVSRPAGSKRGSDVMKSSSTQVKKRMVGGGGVAVKVEPGVGMLPVLPAFIFSPQQTDAKLNPYKGDRCVQFMCESLTDLSKAIQEYNGNQSSVGLYTFHGSDDSVLEQLSELYDIKGLFTHSDFTPFSRLRDRSLQATCSRLGIALNLLDDYSVSPVKSIRTKSSNLPYQVFTPFYKNAVTYTVQHPRDLQAGDCRFVCDKSATELKSYYPTEKWEDLYALHKSQVVGGREHALAVLYTKLQSFKNYADSRNFPRYETTGLAPYQKFGCVSPREVYHSVSGILGRSSALIRQLYWRDFFYHVCYHFPYVMDSTFKPSETDSPASSDSDEPSERKIDEGDSRNRSIEDDLRFLGSAMKRKYDGMKWSRDGDALARWKAGRTGFPLVDAGIRQMLKSGIMHNRTRMAVAQFLTKHLWIDWREGERFFAQHLVDYDPCANNGGWQWCSSTGADGVPYFRVFNPWRQTERFDPQCHYIYQWIPELRKVPVKDVLNWAKAHTRYRSCGYPAPMCDHKERRQNAIDQFKNYLDQNK